MEVIFVKKKLLLYLLLPILILIAVIYIRAQIIAKVMEKDVIAYLQTKGYSSNDILKSKGLVGKSPVYSVIIEFKDEPGKKYYYVKNKNGVFQIQHPMRGKHNEELDIEKYQQGW